MREVIIRSKSLKTTNISDKTTGNRGPIVHLRVYNCSLIIY
jgi:hypothetical protein